MVERYRPKRKINRVRSGSQEKTGRPRAAGSYVAIDGTVCKAKRVTTFTETSVGKLKLPAQGQVEFFERLERGRHLVLRLSYGGTKAWRIVYYENGRPRAKTLGRYPDLGVAAARKASSNFDPQLAQAAGEAGTFRDVAEDWLERYVAKKGLRSQPEIERQLNKYIYPAWANVALFDIRRKTVNALLDKIEDRHGAPQADGVLATIRSIFNWYQTRDDDYTSPIVRGMKRDHRGPKDRQRDRVLNFDEIRAVWKAADNAGQFGAIVKLALLTGQRREKIATMRWDDIDDGDWTISQAPREKGNGGRLKLPKAALDIIEAQPVIDENPHVFAGSRRGQRHGRNGDLSDPPAFNSWSLRKAELDKSLSPDMPRWTMHDLRRTTRSLLAHLEVRREVAEALLGHVIPGVEAVYDRYDYYDQKAVALSRLATLLHEVVNPSPQDKKVVQMPVRAEG